MFNKLIFKTCRLSIRIFTKHYQICNSENLVTPAVYVVHHQNLRGPIISMAWLDIPIRPWVLSVFCNQRACLKHYYNYTFTKRFDMTSVIAAVIAFPLSFLVSATMKSMQAIPVFRSTKDIMKTFDQSISALVNGQNLLISPDIDYTDKSSKMGDIYKGFLNLDKYYKKQTGKHIVFIPMRIDNEKHCISIGKKIYLNDGDNFKAEKEKVYKCLLNELEYPT